MRIARRSIRSDSGCVTTCLVRLMILGVVIGITGIVVFGFLLTKNDVITINLTSRRTASGSVILLPARNGPPPGLLVMTTKDGSADYQLSYLTHTNPDIRWDSPSLGRDSMQTHVTPGSGLVYIATGKNRLLALDQDSGDKRWDVDLSDGIAPLCQDCLRVIGDTVIALTGDGLLQAFDAASGESLWQAQLNATPGHLMIIRGRLAVVDTLPGDTAAVLLLFDPHTGRMIQRIEPHCASGEWDEALSVQSPVLHTPGDRAVYFLFGFSRQGCAQRWDIVSGGKTWETSVSLDEGSWPRTWADNTAFLANGTIYFAGDARGVITTIDTMSGEIRCITLSPEYAVRPLTLSNGMLIVHAANLAGVRRDELWGIDPRSGAIDWRYDFYPNNTSWAVHAAPGGLVVIQMLAEPDQIMVSLLDIFTGQRQSQTTAPVNSTTWTGTTWTRSTAWLTIRDLYTVDLRTGEAALFWPLDQR